MVLALQGGMAVGKTTAARYVAAHAPDVTVFLEDNSPALAALRGRGLDKQRFADYCEIQRAFIQQEIDRYARAAACPCALVDLGPQEIEFYTLHYPSSIGQDWPVEQVLAPELAALHSGRYVDRVLAYHAGIFRALMASGEIAAEDPDTLAMLYVAPVLTLIGICDRQPEREGECLEKLRQHVTLFFRLVHGGNNREI